ncbi:hypothetical protein ElyMa_002428600 [Elysia marginata]|uniref:Uncharacterized protein n=1 Tax=Elysia marginata TaxID=1093978 RepID=A0AAV4GHZ8_9GAST|nr:hypothetical protein ElyMa_002428600 [Elysia marginata]
MRLLLIVCFFALLGAVCLTSAESSHRQKRFLFKKFFTKVIHGAEKAFHKTADVAKKVGRGIARTTKKTVKGADRFIHKSVHWVDHAAHDVAKFGKKTGKGVAKISKKVYFKTEDFVHKSVDWVDHAAHDVAHGVVKAAKFTVKLSKKVGKGVAKISKKIYKASYNAAKKTFNKIKALVNKVDFDDVVLWLIDIIDSDVTSLACEFGCVAAVESAAAAGAPVFPVAPLLVTIVAELACPPICSAVLAKLEDFAEFLAEKGGISKD